MIDPVVSSASVSIDVSRSLHEVDDVLSPAEPVNDIYNQLESINNGISQKSESILESIHKISASSEINMMDLVHVQYQIAQLSLQEHTVMKVSEKSSDCLNALYKHQ